MRQSSGEFIDHRPRRVRRSGGAAEAGKAITRLLTRRACNFEGEHPSAGTMRKDTLNWRSAAAPGDGSTSPRDAPPLSSPSFSEIDALSVCARCTPRAPAFRCTSCGRIGLRAANSILIPAADRKSKGNFGRAARTGALCDAICQPG